MHTVGLVVYPRFQSLGLAVATVFEYANLLQETPAYDFKLVSEQGGAPTFVYAPDYPAMEKASARSLALRDP